MVKLIPLGGENLYKQLLIPLDKTPEWLIGKKREFVMFGGAIASFMFLFKLLMQNLVPSIFELFAVWFVTCVVILALMFLVKMVNRKAKKSNISGIVTALIPLLFLVLLL